jgi:hypothetical protein
MFTLVILASLQWLAGMQALEKPSTFYYSDQLILFLI